MARTIAPTARPRAPTSASSLTVAAPFIASLASVFWIAVDGIPIIPVGLLIGVIFLASRPGRWQDVALDYAFVLAVWISLAVLSLVLGSVRISLLNRSGPLASLTVDLSGPRSLGWVAQPKRTEEAQCSQGDGFACERIALIAEHNGDWDRAFTHHERACMLGEFTACTRAGVLSRRGQGIQADPVRALSLHQRGCDKKDDVACHNLGALQLSRADTKRGVETLKMNCKNGFGRSCLLVGRQLRGRRKTKAARPYFDKACRLGEPEGCTATSRATSSR